MPLKFSPSKKVAKMRKLSVEFLLKEYNYVKSIARGRKLSMSEFVRQATVFALDNLEEKGVNHAKVSR